MDLLFSFDFPNPLGIVEKMRIQNMQKAKNLVYTERIYLACRSPQFDFKVPRFAAHVHARLHMSTYLKVTNYVKPPLFHLCGSMAIFQKWKISLISTKVEAISKKKKKSPQVIFDEMIKYLAIWHLEKKNVHAKNLAIFLFPL